MVCIIQVQGERIVFIIHWLIYRIPQRLSNLCGDLKEYSRWKPRLLEVNIQLWDMNRTNGLVLIMYNV